MKNLKPLALIAPLLGLAQFAHAQNNGKLTLTGTITGRRNADEVWLRSYDRYYRVQRKAAVAVGSRAKAYGIWENGVLKTQNWREIKGAASGKGRSVAGLVWRQLPGEEFEVRQNDGSLYRVLALQNEPETLTVGDTVRAVGIVQGGVLHTGKLILIQEGPVVTPPRNYQPRKAVTGIVTRNLEANRFLMKMSDGSIDRVIALWGEPKLATGMRVRIYGFWDADKGVWQASNLKVLGGGKAGIGKPVQVNRPYGPNYRPRTMMGVVTAKNGVMFSMKAANGYGYKVEIQTGTPGGFGVGDEIRTYGTWRDGILRASNVVVVK